MHLESIKPEEIILVTPLYDSLSLSKRDVIVQSQMEATKQCVKSVQNVVSGVFIVNFEQISHIILVFPFLTLKK